MWTNLSLRGPAKALKEHYDLAQMSKELATINVHADFPYEVEEGKIGELFTAEAYEWFQKLEFKNLLGKFEIQAPASEIEDSFVTVTDPAGMDAVFEKAAGAGTVGVVLERNTENVLPLFAAMSGYFRSGACLFSRREGRDRFHSDRKRDFRGCSYGTSVRSDRKPGADFHV